MVSAEEIKRLSEELQSSRKLLTALGDEDAGPIDSLIQMLKHAKQIMCSLPDRSGND